MLRNVRSNTQILAVLFDLDGTLVDTRIDFASMKRQTLAFCESHGIPAQALEGLDILGAIDRASEILGSSGEGFRSKAWSLLEEIEMSYVPRAKKMDGADDLLLELRKREIRLGLVTRNCRKACDELIKLLPPVFSVTLSREEASRVKPDPLHLFEALEKLGTPAENSLMVGDHRMDILAGQSAGTLTAGVLHGQPDDYFDQESPDIISADLRDLADKLFHTHR